MTEVLRVFVSANETGGALQIHWNGAADARPVYFGSDEMMSLTPREREIRNTVLALLAADAPSEKPAKSVEVATPETHNTLKPRLFTVILLVIVGMSLIVPGFFLGLATDPESPLTATLHPRFSAAFYFTLMPIGFFIEMLAGVLLARALHLQSDRGPQDPALPAA